MDKAIFDMLYALEYSRKQNQFHICLLTRVFEYNLGRLIAGIKSDWVIVGAGSHTEMYELCDILASNRKFLKPTNKRRTP